MKKQILTLIVALVQISSAHAVGSLEVTFAGQASGIDIDAVNEITAVLEEGVPTDIARVEWRKQSSSPEVQLCVSFARVEVLQAYKSKFERVLESRDERTTLAQQSNCN